MRITIRSEGTARITAAIERIKKQLDIATRDATKEAGEALQAAARRNFHGYHAFGYHHLGGDSPNTVSGDLQASIQFLTPVLSEGSARYSTKIGPTAIYGRVIELGATITPKEAKMLSWFDAQMGLRRFEDEVTIPPRPYFRPAVEDLPPRMTQIFYDAWSEALTIA